MNYLPLEHDGYCCSKWKFPHISKLSYKHVFILLIIFISCCLLYFNMSDNSFESLLSLPVLQYRENTTLPLKKFDKFIFLINNRCSGLGNQMLRIAAMYGMGVYPNVKRSPGISFFDSCAKKYIEELDATFPNIMKISEVNVSYIKENVYKKYFYRI